MKFQIKIFLFTIFILLVIQLPGKAQNAYDIIKEMFRSTKSISTLTYEMKKLERINGVMVEQHSFTKLNRSPLKVYVKQLYPKEGIEVLFVPHENNGKALVNPNGFPWFNLSLDPLASTMRKDQHHTLLQSGYDHVINILEFLLNKYEDEVQDIIKITGIQMWNGRECYVLNMKNPHFKYIPYTVGAGENIDTIAAKFMLSQHMIIEKNEGVDDIYDVVEGQQIIIPNDYSPEMVLFIDKQNMVPLVMKVYDDEGLYEHYEYNKISINPYFHPEEFSSAFTDYGF